MNTSWWTQRAVWLAVLLGLALLNLWARPLLPIDETRYVGVAWEMWLRGDFLVPHMNGVPYSHKPPLLFWLIQLGWSIFGVNEWWPRLLPALFAFASLLLTSAIARRLWPAHDRIAVLAPGILLASLLWLFFSTALMFDILLGFWVLLGIHGLLRMLAGERAGWGWLALSLAAGMLTKGPVILLHVLPLAVLAPWWAGQPPRSGWRSWYLALGGALLLAVATVLAWAIPAAIAGGPVYGHDIFWGQTAGRVAKSFAHRREWWWYLPLLPLMLFPWSLWPNGWRALGEACKHHEPGVRLLLAWLAPVFVAFSLISGKQAHYLLPLFPAFALLLARGLQAPLPARARSLLLPALMLAVIGGVLLWLPGQAGSGRIPQDVALIPPLAGGSLIGLAIVLVSGSAREPLRQARFLQFAGVGFIVIMLLFVIHPLTRDQNIDVFSHKVAEVAHRHLPLVHVGNYQDQFQFPGRLLKPISTVTPARLARWMIAHPDGYVLIYLRRPDARLTSVAAAHMHFRSKWLLLLRVRDLRGISVHSGTARS